MSSGLQLDARHHNQWRRHLVNAYEVKVLWFTFTFTFIVIVVSTKADKVCN